MALYANAAASKEPPSREAIALIEASQKAVAVNWQCAEAVGLPALYELQKTIAKNDLQMVGVGRSDAVIMVTDGAKKIETTPRATPNQSSACSKLIDGAREELDYARAKYRKSSGLD